MTLVRLGYVAMSVHLKHASPSKTMTFAQFSKIANRNAAIRKLERITQSNLANCLRLLRYNLENEIHFFASVQSLFRWITIQNYRIGIFLHRLQRNWRQ